MNDFPVWSSGPIPHPVNRHDPSRMKYIIRRQQETIEQQSEEIRDLTRQNHVMSVRDCRYVNAAMEALEALGEGDAIREAQALDHWVKIDYVALLCECVRNLKAGAPC